MRFLPGDNYWRGEPKLIEIFSNEMSSRDFQFALTIVQLLYFNFMYRKYTWNVPKKVEEMIEEMSGLSLYDLEYNYMYDFGPSTMILVVLHLITQSSV